MNIEIKYYKVTDDEGNVSKDIGYVYTRNLFHMEAKRGKDGVLEVLKNDPVTKTVEDKPSEGIVEEISKEAYDLLEGEKSSKLKIKERRFESFVKVVNNRSEGIGKGSERIEALKAERVSRRIERLTKFTE